MTKAETFLLVVCLPAVMLALLGMAMVAILERKFNHPRDQEANGGSEEGEEGAEETRGGVGSAGRGLKFTVRRWQKDGFRWQARNESD